MEGSAALIRSLAMQALRLTPVATALGLSYLVLKLAIATRFQALTVSTTDSRKSHCGSETCGTGLRSMRGC